MHFLPLWVLLSARNPPDFFLFVLLRLIFFFMALAPYADGSVFVVDVNQKILRSFY